MLCIYLYSDVHWCNVIRTSFNHRTLRAWGNNPMIPRIVSEVDNCTYFGYDSIVHPVDGVIPAHQLSSACITFLRIVNSDCHIFLASDFENKNPELLEELSRKFTIRMLWDTDYTFTKGQCVYFPEQLHTEYGNDCIHKWIAQSK